MAANALVPSAAIPMANNVRFSFQGSVTALPNLPAYASMTTVESLIVTANTIGPSGNNITVAANDGTDVDPPTISVDGVDITLTLTTDDRGASITTVGELIDLINNDPDASALVTAASIRPENIQFSFRATNLEGGRDLSTGTIDGDILVQASNEDPRDELFNEGWVDMPNSSVAVTASSDDLAATVVITPSLTGLAVQWVRVIFRPSVGGSDTGLLSGPMSIMGVQ